MNTLLRGTGRTTKMLLEAAISAMNGKNVLVFMSNEDQALMACERIDRWELGFNRIKKNKLEIKNYRNNGSIEFCGYSSYDNKMLGNSKFLKTFIDHYVWEAKWAKYEK